MQADHEHALRLIMPMGYNKRVPEAAKMGKCSLPDISGSNSQPACS